MIFPPRPKAGDTILLVSPSSPLKAEEPVERIARAIEERGYRVRIGASCRGQTACGYAAASAAVRAQDINRGFADPDIKGIWCTRGGSTAARMLPLLDYQLIRANPKPLLGFSDVTSLHMAIQQRCGLVTYHGPTANRLLQFEKQDWSWESLAAVMEMEERLTITNPPGEAITPLRPGTACGELIGGNLSLVTASLATPWEIDTTGRVLYLEDVGEAVYALERMLTQLRWAGVLDKAAAVVLGPFTNCRNAYREDYGPEALLRDFFADYPKPVIANVRSAHCMPMVTLPLGACCQVDGNRGELTVFRR